LGKENNYFAGDTTGTLDNDNAQSLNYFYLGAGTILHQEHYKHLGVL
jgi:hypothetical protein